MRFILFIAVLIHSSTMVAQDYKDTIAAHRLELQEEFANVQSSPLDSADRLEFTELPYFPIQESYRIMAHWEVLYDQPIFEMPTTTSRTPKYRVAGIAHFTINGDSCSLTAYQNMRLLEKEGYEDYLFIPFTDYSNGMESYGGGRYVEAHLPEEKAKTVIIDFNKAYNPYCAYSDRYSCPVVPEVNALEVYIPAGVKFSGHH